MNLNFQTNHETSVIKSFIMRFACWDMLCTFNIDNLEVEANNVWHDMLQQVLKITVYWFPNLPWKVMILVVPLVSWELAMLNYD